MVKRTIVIWFMFFVLFGGAIWEEIYISQSLDALQDKTTQIEQSIINQNYQKYTKLDHRLHNIYTR